MSIFQIHRKSQFKGVSLFVTLSIVKISKSSTLLLAFIGLVSLVRLASAQSSSNGVYGGFTASDQWFADMEHSAANQAMIRAVSGTGNFQKLPPDYVEIAGRIVFPGGNPFPDKELPDLRIDCVNQHVDAVDRAPFLNNQAEFYTVLKRGQTYDFYWFYYFGSREKFARITISTRGPRRRKLVIAYRWKGSAKTSHKPDIRKHSSSRLPTVSQSEVPPANANDYDLSDFPMQPTNFEEQQVQAAINSASTSELKAEAHKKLAEYYQEKGDKRRASAEFVKARYWGQNMSEHSSSRHPTVSQSKVPPVNVNEYDLSDFPKQPTNFEEQLVQAAINSASTPELKAEAHTKLAKYYEKKGDKRRASAEFAKARYWSEK